MRLDLVESRRRSRIRCPGKGEQKAPATPPAFSGTSIAASLNPFRGSCRFPWPSGPRDSTSVAYSSGKDRAERHRMLKGNLSSFSLGEIFQSLAINNHTGTLKITTKDGGQKCIYF